MIINKLHPAIKRMANPAAQQFVRFKNAGTKHRIYFSAGAVVNLNIEERSYASFEKRGDVLLVWFNYNKNGFLLYSDRSHGLWISNSSLVKHLTDGKRVNPEDRFKIERCELNRQGCATLKISLTERV